MAPEIVEEILDAMAGVINLVVCVYVVGRTTHTQADTGIKQHNVMHDDGMSN